MLRGMVFVDHQNFIIEVKKYYNNKSLPEPKLDYNVLFRNMAMLVKNVDFIKACMYIPKPDKFLMQDQSLANAYDWVNGMRTKPFLDIVEGRYIARRSDPAVSMDITNKKTYYKVEKGTDINLAIDAISMAFHNSFDIAFIVSADTDYLRVYDMLKSLGKLVIVIAVNGQNVSKIRPHVDNVILLDDAFFNTCLKITPTKTTSITSPAAKPVQDEAPEEDPAEAEPTEAVETTQ